jgi:DNA-binding response OmpR family regulator
MARTALIIEDESELAELFAQIAAIRGLECHIINQGQGAVEWVREHKPDLILLDLMLPGRDGYAICKELKLDRATSHIPIVMVTARARHSDMVYGLEVGANEYLTKPFTIDQMLDAIDRAVKWRNELSKCGCEGEVQFELKSDTKYLEQLNDMLASLFLHSGLSEENVRHLTTAVREMGMNAIEWGHRKQADRVVTVTYRIERDRVVIAIRDTGPGFNRQNLDHAADENDPAKHMDVRNALGLRPGGFGILMTRGLVDEMQYNERGNEVRLVKYFARKSAS